jgi:hypothetical protein
MIAKYIRFTDSCKAPGWVGLVVAHTRQQLFSTIDEMGDPYSCQLKSLNGYGAIMCVTSEFDGDGLAISGDRATQLELDYSERLWWALREDDGWQTPDWSDIHNPPHLICELMGWKKPCVTS